MGRYDGKEEERTLLLTPQELNQKSKGGRSWIVEGFSRAVTWERKWIRAQRMGEKDSRAGDGGGEGCAQWI
jgi:hypothetical protein